MVSTKAKDAAAGVYYVGVPMEVFMKAFDGFDLVDDHELPGEVDTVIVGDVTCEEFKSRFRFRRYPSIRRGNDVLGGSLMTPDQHAAP